MVDEAADDTTAEDAADMSALIGDADVEALTAEEHDALAAVIQAKTPIATRW